MAILPDLLVSAAILQDALIGKDGLPLAGGIVTLYQENSRTTLKNWYYQSGTPGHYMWITLPNPLTLSAAGTITDVNGNDVIPFFYPWFTDEDGNTIYQSYYITVYNSRGELQFTRANFPFDPNQINPNPPNNPIATLENLIINNRFWRNIGSIINAGNIPLPAPYDKGPGYIQNGNFGLAYNDTPIPTPPGPPLYYYITLAPSQNDGFSMPDFNYIKNAIGGAESISFPKFPSTNLPALSGDVMPEFYIAHVCGTQDPGVSIKVYQFPISLHLDTLAGQQASVSVQARSNTGGTQLTLAIYQFQGTGNTSVQPQPIGVFQLSTSWQKYTANFEFGNNLNALPSSTGDDAWYLQIGMPILVGPFEVEFTLPSLYLNPVTDIPTTDFQTYDQIDAVVSKPRTGDLRTSINQFYPYGWVPMNNGTIGNNITKPDPAFLPTTRNNIDTWPLFNLIWNLFAPYSTGDSAGPGLNPIAPMYLTGVADTQVGYGPNVTNPTTALMDWDAGRQLSLTKSMGQVMLGTAPVTALLSTYMSVFTATNSIPALLITLTTPMNVFKGMPIYVSNSGGALPGNLTANTIYYITADSAFTLSTFHLSLTFVAAMAGTAIAFTTAGTGTQTLTGWLSGTNEGEYAHGQTAAEVGPHTHTGSVLPGSIITTATTGPGTTVVGQGVGTLPLTIATNSPNGAGANVTQPGTFNNIYIKL